MRHGGYRSSDLMYQGKHHTDVVFQNRFLEKLFMESDNCDGIIWEKNHSDDMILSMTSWYPGYYSSTSFQGTRLIQQDPRMPHVLPGSIGGECFMRTKDFVISKIGSYYYAPTGSYSVSRDGKKWTKRISGAPASWLGSISGWSTKENVGMLADSGKIYRFDIDDDGKLTWTEIAEDLGSGAAIADIIQQGIVQDGTHRWYRFINPEGELYTSRLPDHYTYDFEDWWGTHSVVDGTYSWSFYYINGKYIAFTANKISHVKAYSTSNYVYWYDVIFVESDDGFKTIRSKVFESPKLTYSYQSVSFFYFENKYLMYEGGETVDGNVRTPYLWIWDFGNSYFNTPKKIVVPQTFTVPMVGMYSDKNVDDVTVVTYGSVPAKNRNYIRGFGGFTNAIYIKDGKVTEPYGGIIIPTAFKPNGWSSNAYDEGGWIYLDGGMLRAPKRGIAYGGSNYMVDRDNATWGEDYYKITIKGGSGTMRLAEEKARYIDSYTIEKGTEDWVKHCYFHIDQIAKLTYDNKIVRRRLRRGGQTFFELRDPEYNVDSGYYMEGTGVYSTVFGREFSKVNSGSAYVFIIGYLSRGNQYISPMVISTDEFNVVYDPGGPVTNSKIIDYGGFKWYYNGFSYGFGGDDPTVPYYLNLHSLGGSATEQEMVLECLKTVHPVN